MSEKRWTHNQKNAISARGGSLLVSAAAGSGKTAVLVQRIIEQITDEKDPVDINKLLVVTFTNAAADEIRERIYKKISELLMVDPNNILLQRQQVLVLQSHISTIHSFCTDLIREFFYRLDVSPEFRIADANEVLLMMSDAIDIVLEKKYKEESPRFIDLVMTFSNTKNDDRFVDILKTFYRFVSSQPYPERWMKEKLSMYTNHSKSDKTVWGEIILEFSRDSLSYCIMMVENAIDIAKSDEELFQVSSGVLFEDLRRIKEIRTDSREVLIEGLKEVRFARMSLPRKYTHDPAKNRISAIRKEIKDTISRLSKLFTESSVECNKDLQRVYPIVKELFSITIDLNKEFNALKSEKNVLDFSDLEHFAIQLLTKVTDDGGIVKTPEAIEISKRFKEIMVDEYQDTNETQDLIFSAISQDERNLFIVGDVKQSIYGFRQAMPEIFLKRQGECSEYESVNSSFPAKIMLDMNFRSSLGVVNAINFIFNKIMSKDIGGVEYERERLVAGACYPCRGESAISLELINLSESFSSDMDRVEAHRIAQIIKNKIANRDLIQDSSGKSRPVMYKDFCVLLRSVGRHAANFVKELERQGIPCWSDVGGNFFGTKEISAMLSLLRVIDNPIQDIPLLAVLMSPLYAFSVDDIARIRISDREAPFYFALKKLASEDDTSKFALFLRDIDQYRNLAANSMCSTLINFIYEKTGFVSIVSTMGNGNMRRANLRMLVEYAKVYEKSGYKGLAEFVRFIDRVQQQDVDFAPPVVLSEFSDVVKVMSVHRSKGLEFPICIVANCSRRFNKDNANSLLMNSRLGPGMRIIERDRFLLFSNFIRDAIVLEMDNEMVSEELRILYVALTRAKEKVILLCSFKNVEKAVTDLACRITNKGEIYPYAIQNATSFSDWILMVALLHPSGSVLREIALLEDGFMVEDDNAWDIKRLSVREDIDYTGENVVENTEVDESLLNAMRKNFSFNYARESLIDVPAKISVSQLEHQTKPREMFLSRPSFLSKDGASSVEKGIAFHTFVQFADFDIAVKNPREHLLYLIEKGFLTKQQANLIDVKKLTAFLNSDIVWRIRQSELVLREFRFTINIEASEVKEIEDELQGSEKVILQGAIDCAFKENGKYVIIDYKTDRIDKISELADMYSGQILMYRRALCECTMEEVSECILYSFYLNEWTRVC